MSEHAGRESKEQHQDTFLFWQLILSQRAERTRSMDDDVDDRDDDDGGDDDDARAAMLCRRQ